MPKQFKEAEKFLKQGLKLGISSKHQESLAKFERSLAVFRQIKDRGKEALTLNCMGETYQTIGQERKAQEFHQQALEITEEIGDLELHGSNVRNMGFVHCFLGYYDKAETWFRQALKLHEQMNDQWNDQWQVILTICGSSILLVMSMVWQLINDVVDLVRF